MIRFKSKRNQVWLEGGRVHKLILGGACSEAEILRGLYVNGVAVPEVFSVDGDMIIMEYIEGSTLTDEIEREVLDADKLAVCLVDWFAAFYLACPGKIRGDVNCRNFIVAPGFKIYGVDFEDLQDGAKEKDAGRIAAFILNYAPEYTDYKKRLASAFIDCFCVVLGVEREVVLSEQALEIDAMRERRK